MWAKISASATAMACAACLAAAAVTLPAVEKAGSDLAKTADVNVKLAVDLSQLAALDAIPAYIAFLTSGNFDNLAGVVGVNALTTLFGSDGVFSGAGINALFPDVGGVSPGYDALGALDVFFGNNDGTTGGGVFTGGGINALNNYAALSAIPGGFERGPEQLGFGECHTAIHCFRRRRRTGRAGRLGWGERHNTFFGTNGVFGSAGNGIDALLPGDDTTAQPGYAALSALPVFVGSHRPGLLTTGAERAVQLCRVERHPRLPRADSSDGDNAGGGPAGRRHRRDGRWRRRVGGTAGGEGCRRPPSCSREDAHAHGQQERIVFGQLCAKAIRPLRQRRWQERRRQRHQRVGGHAQETWPQRRSSGGRHRRFRCGQRRHSLAGFSSKSGGPRKGPPDLMFGPAASSCRAARLGQPLSLGPEESDPRLGAHRRTAPGASCV